MTTKAPKFAPFTGQAALAMRQKTGLNQSRFWSVVGIGQSAGSRRMNLRYEILRAVSKTPGAEWSPS